MPYSLSGKVGLYKVCQCPACGKLSISQGQIRFNCKFCGKGKNFIGHGKTGPHIQINIIAHSDDAEAAKEALLKASSQKARGFELANNVEIDKEWKQQ